MRGALENGAQKVIHTSTSEVYGTARFVPIDESHPLQPQSPYSATKIAADTLAMNFFHTFNLPMVVARPFNTYGPRQSARAVIPTITSQIISGAKNIKLRSLHPTRDYNYVLDTCGGLANKREYPANSEVERLVCDNAKLKSLTGFTPKFALDSGLRKTIEWFSGQFNLKMYKSGIYNV